jgi:threonylcarbamoyladenosine tRNA methylthiotransferase MtaB
MDHLTSSSSRYDFTVHTFGCKVNTYDTGLLQKRLQSQGHRLAAASLLAVAPAPQMTTATSMTPMEQFGLGARTPRIHILNTCAVTATATQDAAKLVRRLKAKDPFATVVVTGCGAQVDGEVFDQMPGADLVIANSHKGKLEQILDEHFAGNAEKVFRSNIFRKDDLEAGGGVELGHTRTFLKIQDGCNSFCTYCVIPFARGKSRSISVDGLISRIKELRTQGIMEFVLTGVHIGDYEDEKNGKKLLLHDLISEVLERTDVPRLRLSSLEPVELDSRLLALFKNDRLCPHFHMSIQSANTQILSAMRRKYDAGAVESALHSIARELPNSFVGMDVIAGFPGEGEAEFADTYERLASLPWTRLHVFPYSERPGTKAAVYEGVVPREVRAMRSARLRTLSSERFSEAANAQRGLVKKVLILKDSGNGSEGLSRDYWPVKLQEVTGQAGREIAVEVTGYDDSTVSRMDGVLTGRLIDQRMREA